jgi:fluoride ion exporter CrcB/FEX
MSRDERRPSSALPFGEYGTPDTYHNLDEISPPIQNPDNDRLLRNITTREDAHRHPPSVKLDHSIGLERQHSQTVARHESRLSRRRSSQTQQSDYNAPNNFENLGELAAVSPVQNPEEAPVYQHENLEEVRTRDQEDARRRQSQVPQPPSEKSKEATAGAVHVSRLATQIYTLSYLILFSILGTLARLGLQALTSYPGAPVVFSSIWPNFAGSLVMGFLTEDRMLFSHEWGIPTYANELRKARSGDATPGDLAAAKKAHAAMKKTIPLYIGLATGFCGSFTSFSSFIRDIFLALSNNLSTPGVSTIPHRNGGYSFMALLAVAILTISLSLSGLFLGAHLAIATEPIIPAIPYPVTRKILDRIAVFLALGCWLGAVLLSALPPDRFSRPGASELWRGRATFALVFAPLGCLTRFYASLYLNGKVASFPLGTFSVNVFGTAVLGMAWVLAHVPLGGTVGCQVLQGVEDGFCGCLTTVSTWVAELNALRRRHAYVYGAVSVAVSLAVLVIIMGSLRWTRGFGELLCTH